MLERFLDKTEFESYEDFMENFRVNIPDNFNFGYDVVDEWARVEPDKKALLWTNESGDVIQFTFADIKRESDKAASFFLSLGIKKGDMVMLILKRRYQFWFSIIALHKIGAVTIPATHLLTAKDIVYRCNAADIKAVVAVGDDVVLKHIMDAKPDCPTLKYCISIGPDVPEGWLDFSKGCEEAAPFVRPEHPNSNDDISLMYFTSGTTGKPKGVMHSHTYALSHIITAKYWQETYDGGLHFTVAETGWAKASWGKFYGQWLTGSAVMVYDFDTFDPSQLVHIINRFGVTSFCAPPTVYRYMIRKNSEKMPTLRSATTAGEYLSPDIFTSFRQLTGLTLKEGYGQTESALIAGNFSAEKAVDGSMGTFSPLYRAMIVREDGSECDINEKGEIVIIPEDGKRPIGLFSSYLDDDKSYEEAWEGGVYHTGDAASRDENGYLWFMGRIDDIIKSCGYRVGPGEIEDIIITHPAVCECSVIGIPDTLRGQSIKAYIILSEGYSESRELEKEIREYCNSRLADYKWIRKISFVESFQKTISGKIMKTELRKAEGF